MDGVQAPPAAVMTTPQRHLETSVWPILVPPGSASLNCAVAVAAPANTASRTPIQQHATIKNLRDSPESHLNVYWYSSSGSAEDTRKTRGRAAAASPPPFGLDACRYSGAHLPVHGRKDEIRVLIKQGSRVPPQSIPFCHPEQATMDTILPIASKSSV